MNGRLFRPRFRCNAEKKRVFVKMSQTSGAEFAHRLCEQKSTSLALSPYTRLYCLWGYAGRIFIFPAFVCCVQNRREDARDDERARQHGTEILYMAVTAPFPRKKKKKKFGQNRSDFCAGIPCVWRLCSEQLNEYTSFSRYFSLLRTAFLGEQFSSLILSLLYANLLTFFFLLVMFSTFSRATIFPRRSHLIYEKLLWEKRATPH